MGVFLWIHDPLAAVLCFLHQPTPRHNGRVQHNTREHKRNRPKNDTRYEQTDRRRWKRVSEDTTGARSLAWRGERKQERALSQRGKEQLGDNPDNKSSSVVLSVAKVGYGVVRCESFNAHAHVPSVS